MRPYSLYGETQGNGLGILRIFEGICKNSDLRRLIQPTQKDARLIRSVMNDYSVSLHMNKRTSIILFIITLIVIATWAFLPISWNTHRLDVEGQMILYDTITILTPLVSKILLWASALLAACLFILANLAYKWSVIRFPPKFRTFGWIYQHYVNNVRGKFRYTER